MKKKKMQNRLDSEKPELKDAPSSALKQQGVTSSFSSATNSGASYGGDDIESNPTDDAETRDQSAKSSNDEPADPTSA